MKVGDKIKGFKFKPFENSARLNYNLRMNDYIGIEGTLIYIDKLTFLLEFDDSNEWNWEYPTHEYYQLTRDEKLKQLGL